MLFLLKRFVSYKKNSYICVLNHKSMLAKSTPKITLIEHSRNVSIIAERMLKEAYPSELYGELKDVVIIASLLHDIGKCTKHFQKILKNNQDEDEIKKVEYTHNIISWAWVTSLLNGQGIDNVDLICDAILWHHGIYTYDSKITSKFILQKLSNEDLTSIESYSKLLLDGSVSLKPIKLKSKPLPAYYDNDLMEDESCLKTIVRGILLFADRFVSANDGKDIDFNTITLEPYLNKKNLFTVDSFILDNSERSLKQLSIIEEIDNSTNNTFIVKASAGFGKTRLGLLWSLKRKKRLIWVAPRNDVATSLYYSITKEIVKLGLTHGINEDVRVSCYYSNEVQEGHEDIDSADIIITNIDSFLGNSFKSNKLYNLSLINTTDVVFDEFHELICGDGIFSLFTHLLKIRNNYTKAKTLLLSATPMDFEFLVNDNNFFNNHDADFKYLPSKNSHYNAQHTKPYSLRIGNFTTNIVTRDKTLVICNSIKQTQEYGFKYDMTHIYHSEFTNNDRKEKLANILFTFGETPYESGENNLVGARVLQSSLDISLKEMYEMVLSPEATLQRIGRVNRWGENDKSILFMSSFTENPDSFDSREKTSVERGYNLKLHKLWYKFLKDNDGQDLTLDELYNLYNEFYRVHEEDCQSHVQKLHGKSQERILNIFPRRKKITKGKKLILNSPDSLRGNGKSLFFTCKEIIDNETYITPISKEIYGNDDDYFFKNEFEESETHINILRRQVPFLESAGFDFSNFKDYKTASINEFRKRANNADSPYYRTDVVYDKKFGVIKRNNMIHESILRTLNSHNSLNYSDLT